MNYIKHPLLLLILIISAAFSFTGQIYAETTMTVNFTQRISQGVITPDLPIGGGDQSIPIKCILYKESGRCVFDPDIEAVQTYEIYSGTQRLGIYSSQSSFVHDVFSFRGILYLTLKTRNSELTGKVYNY